jgi:glycolate oxidase FAD binding subunit
MLHLGLPPKKPGVAVDLRGLNHVIDYPARDMTITVQAGITIAKLQAILAGENQQLPVDVPMPEQATLGGAIAVNASGPRRYGYGTLRDYVIGISFINSEGQEVKAGGRVVKNVAGYDLMKLHIGALGTLGIVTQVSLKLRPLPEDQGIVWCECEDQELHLVLEKLHRSRTRPVLIELLNPATARARLDRNTRKWIMFVGIDGNRESVAWQMEQLKTGLPRSSCESREFFGPACQEGRNSLCDWLLRPEARFSFTSNVSPSGTAKFCLAATALADSLQLQAHAGNGIVLGHVDALTLEQARTMLTTLHDAAGPDGNVVVTHCPPEWKRELPIWGKPRGDAWLMRRVKEALDPRGVFNPGRFVDGI